MGKVASLIQSGHIPWLFVDSCLHEGGLDLTSSTAKVLKTVPGTRWGLFSQFFFSHRFIWAVGGAVGIPRVAAPHSR